MLQDKIEKIKEDFKVCSSILNAIGDETRQLIIIALMDSKCEGMRVGEIQSKTHLSRPAVSHHLKILRESEIVAMDKVGTKNFYYLLPDSKIMLLKTLILDIDDFIKIIEKTSCK